MSDARDPRGGYDFWQSFVAGHSDAEDIMLASAAELIGDTPLTGDAPKELSSGPVPVQPEPGIVMDDGEEVSFDGHLDPIEDADTDGMSDEQIEALARRATFMNPKLLGYNGRASIIGIEVSNGLRDMVCEAWDHYVDDHQCEGATLLLDRIIEQLVSAFHVARDRTQPPAN